MTKKAILSAWASRLGVNCSEGATAAQLEQGIDQAISSLTTVDDSDMTLAQGIQNNWAVLRAEVPATVRAIAVNLQSPLK